MRSSTCSSLSSDGLSFCGPIRSQAYVLTAFIPARTSQPQAHSFEPLPVLGPSQKIQSGHNLTERIVRKLYFFVGLDYSF